MRENKRRAPPPTPPRKREREFFTVIPGRIEDANPEISRNNVEIPDRSAARGPSGMTAI
jgi:hypothetical protein